ncbi:Heterokaryon incompatibility protein (HET) domain containing protein [Naviculisporaceae sp. PSN 640]
MFGNARHVSRFLPKNAVVSRVKKWLQACDEHHTCSTSPGQELPTRLLDISGRSPKIVESQGVEMPSGRYVTLSHCWGDPSNSRPTMTTRQNLESRKIGILARELSPLFKDAIALCKGVGCDYIWIDSLCIIQDDDLDWETESQKMAEVYSNAYFNIAATRCANSTDSLFQDRWTFGDMLSDERCPLREYPVGVSLAPGRPVYARISHDDDHRYVRGGDGLLGRHDQAPLLKRAWVLQEVLLAPRVLHVCASELIWECEELYDCECGSIISATSSNASLDASTVDSITHRKREFAMIRNGRVPLSTESFRDFWLRITQTYSSLSITKHSDRPLALAGLVDAVRGRLNRNFCLGICLEDLPRALLWRAHYRCRNSASRSADTPTWSWMSCLSRFDNYHITYDFVLHVGFKLEPKTSTFFTSRDQEDKGKRHFQSITFRGPALIGRTIKTRESTGGIEYYAHLSPDSTRDVSHPGAINHITADCPTWREDPLCDGDVVACLLFGTDLACSAQFILIVKICPDMENGGITYCRRVGICFQNLKGHDGRYIDHFEGADILTMRLI